MENQKLPRMSLSVLQNALSRVEMKNVVGGDDQSLDGDDGGDCISRWWGCSAVTEDTNCCGSGKCMEYNGYEQCV